MELFAILVIICVSCILFTQYYGRPMQEPNPISGSPQLWPKIPVWIFWGTIIFISAFRYGFCDTGLYREICKTMGTDYAKATAENLPIDDVGFNYLMIFLNRCGFDPQSIIVVTSIVIYSIYAHVINKYSPDLPFTLTLFLVLTYLTTINGIRQVMAAAIIMLGLDWVRDRRFLPYALLVLFASTIHASAIVMLPLYFVVSGGRMNFLVWVFYGCVAVFFVAPGLANSILGSILEDSVYEDYLTNESKMGIMRLLVASVPLALSVVFSVVQYRTGDIFNVSPEVKRMTAVLINMQLISFGFTILGLRMVYFARLSMYFDCVLPLLLSSAIRGSFHERSARTVKIIAICLYVVYFGYQIIIFQNYGYFNDFRLVI